MATPDMNQLRRVREPVSRSKAGIQGKVADVFSGCSRHAESQNEIKAWEILTATARTDSWQEQPFTLEYHDGGAKHRYTPDALVVRGCDRVVVEVKEDKDAENSRGAGAIQRHQRASRGPRVSVPRVEVFRDSRRTALGFGANENLTSPARIELTPLETVLATTDAAEGPSSSVYHHPCRQARGSRRVAGGGNLIHAKGVPRFRLPLAAQAR